MFVFRHISVTVRFSLPGLPGAMQKREMNKRQPLVCCRKNDYSLINRKERSCAIPQ